MEKSPMENINIKKKEKNRIYFDKMTQSQSI